MEKLQWSVEQLAIINAPFNRRIFLKGNAGTGKTSAGVKRMLTLVASGIPAESILVLVPQRTLAKSYFSAISDSQYPSGNLPEIVTLGGLSQRLISLFWPLIANRSGFTRPKRPFSFLTLETAQYFLSQIAQPLIEEGYFESVSIDRNRLFSQILDNLNKSAAIGFPYTEISTRLAQAWIGEPSQIRVYQDAQECANRFRAFCLDHNLLDYSLQIDLFKNILWTSFLCREYLFTRFKHLIYENVEEDIPIAHDILREWLPKLDSALVICDSDGGYRSFLGADPVSAQSLQNDCDMVVSLDQSWVTSPALESYRASMVAQIRRLEPIQPSPDIRGSIHFSTYHFTPLLIDGICQQCTELVNHQGIPPGEIAILSPFLSDSLRFSLMNHLEERGIPSYSHRPSRSLSEEPATRCLLIMAKLAHPEWGLPINRHALRSALVQSISNLDLIRADLLSQIVLSRYKLDKQLGSFDLIRVETQERITYSVGQRYESLRLWIAKYQTGQREELDVFLSRLFGELLSQPGFGFHNNYSSASVAARLIESVHKFRKTTGEDRSSDKKSLGCEYIKMVEEGVISAQYIHEWVEPPDNSIFIAPAYTFLMINRPVSVQFWLDVGSQAWWERLYQPLTHPYILSRQWIPGQVWTDGHEVAANQLQLSRLVSGLISRCKKEIYLSFLGINEQGREQRGILLTALQNIQKKLPPD